MKDEDLLKSAVDWQHETWAERLNACASMLYLHGFIPMSQREKIGAKLEARFASAMSAQRAETAGLGATPASAVPEGETPTPCRSPTQDTNHND